MQVTDVDFVFVTFFIQFGMVVLQFACTLIPDHREILVPKQKDGVETEPLLGKDKSVHFKTQELEGKQCPKIGATFPSVLFFHWFTP